MTTTNKYRVYVRHRADEVWGHVDVAALDADHAQELMKEAWDESPDDFVWDPADDTKYDPPPAVRSVEALPPEDTQS